MEAIVTYILGCKLGISRISLLFLGLCMIFNTSAGVPCKKNDTICGCIFVKDNETMMISMMDINNNDGTPYFSDVKGDGSFFYYVNPCTGFNYTATHGTCTDVSGCQKSKNGTLFTIAKPGLELFDDYFSNTPLKVTYKMTPGGRQMFLYLLCHEDVEGRVTSIVEHSSQYNVTIESKHVCPQPYPPKPFIPGNANNEGLSTGSILVIIFFVVLVIYLVAGILFMKYKKGATGKEVIPNVEFWSSIPGLVKDGCVFFGTKVKQLCQRACQRDGYNEI